MLYIAFSQQMPLYMITTHVISTNYVLLMANTVLCTIIFVS